MTDARAEARRRIATALHTADCGCPDYEYDPNAPDPLSDAEDPRYGELADAVLDLFERIDLNPLPGWVYGDGASSARQLVLTGRVEPVVPEEPQHA